MDLMAELEKQFPWMPMIKRGFLKSFTGDYKAGTLELLQQNIAEEFLKVKDGKNLERASLLFECVEYFYYHFCRKWYQWEKFSSRMEVTWVHILSNYVKIGVILSRGKKDSWWVNKVTTVLMRFPGEKNLMYDGLLSVSSLLKKYKPVYGAILMSILVNASLFVPRIIDEPAEYLKVCLLFRRLNGIIKEPAEKFKLRMKASKTLAPASLSNWLLVHEFNVNWTYKTSRINVGLNIFKKLMGKKHEKEAVETLRKMLLPEIFRRPLSDYNKMDRASVKRKNHVADNVENIPLCDSGSSEKRYSDYLFEVDKEMRVIDTKIKNKKVKKSRNNVSELVPFAGDSQMESKSKKKKRKKNSVSCPLSSEDNEEGISVKRKWEEMGKSKKERKGDFLSNDDFEMESKRKRRKGDAEKCPKLVHETSDDRTVLNDISQTSKTTKGRKRRRRKQKTKKSEDLPMIVAEVNKNMPVSDGKVSLSKFETGNSSPVGSDDDDDPVIVTEIKHYSNFGLSSFNKKKSQPIKNELSSIPKTKTTSENIFVIDSEPSPCTMESSAASIAHDSEQKYPSSYEKSENISNNKEDLTSPVNFQDKSPLSETSAVLKIVEKSHIIEETQNSCLNTSSHLENGQSSACQISAISVSNLADESLISEKEKSISSNNLTAVNENGQNCNEAANNVISSNIKKHSSHINQTAENSSRDSIVQTGNSNCSSNQVSDLVENSVNCRSDLTSEKLSDENEKFPLQADIQKKRTEEDISKEDIPLIESHGSCMLSSPSLNNGTCAEGTEIQRDNNTSIKTEVPVSDTDKVNDFGDTNLKSTEVTENYSEVSIKKEKEEILQEERVAESSIDSPSNTPCLEINDGSSQSTAETVSSESVNNSERINLESGQDSDSTELKNDAPLKHSVSRFLENESSVESMNCSLNTNNYSREIKKEKLTLESSAADTLSSKSVNNSERNNLESGQDSDSIESKNAPLKHAISGSLENESSVESMDYSLNTNIYSHKIKKEKLTLESSSPRKVDSVVITNSDGDSSIEIDVVNDSYTDLHSPTQNESVHEFSKDQLTGSFCDEKSPVSRTDIDDAEDTERSKNHPDFDKSQIVKDNMAIEIKSNETESPNSSAAKGLMESMLKLVERASCARDESLRQNILKGSISSSDKKLSLEFLLRVTSPKHDESVKCLSFLDISSENDSSHNEIQSFNVHASKSTEFLNYRDLLADRDDNRSEDALSDSKSIPKTEASEYPSDASIDTEDDGNSSSSDSNLHLLSSDAVPEASNPENNYDTYVVKSELVDCQDDGREQWKRYASLKNRILKNELIPVVNLGGRCDNKTSMDSNVSKDTSLLPAFKAGETKPFEDNQISSTVSQSPNQTREITIKPEVDDDSPLVVCGEITIKPEVDDSSLIVCGEIIDNNDVKMDIRPEQNDVKELDLTANQKITVSDDSQELVELKDKKELVEATRSDKDQESVEPTNENLSQDQEDTKTGENQELIENKKEEAPRSMRLRKRLVPAVESQVPAPAKEDSCIQSQGSSTTRGRSLRNRNPSSSSSQEVKKSKAQTTTKRSSKRLKKEVNVNLGFDFSVLSIDTPKISRSKTNDSSSKSSFEVATDVPTSSQENSSRRVTRSSVISSNADTKIKTQDTGAEGYRLRSRKTVIMPGRLNF